ncbi:MAG: uracil-DNA glycosylase [Candidatus Nomurabacteria bacterium]|nr:uracil-DNA glycosylase [Candidatus Nomurabacteria bacterium]USN88017.1 MAG: uracil-DNA glycosylase [Candidatus Nomurabacteria bacterium]
MNVNIEKSWQKALAEEFEKPYFKDLTAKVRQAYLDEVIYPHPKNIFNAFSLCPFSEVKVVILGQDPYHGPGQAHGLCFSVPDGVKIPPSLNNIYKEIKADLGKDMPDSGNLERWAEQGVLLLNATLTVRGGVAGSHQGLGWETFTDTIIKTISDQKEHVVFLLWGRYAQAKTSLIDSSKHLILTSPHPSPLSAHNGWFGSKHFSQTNAYLEKYEQKSIEW